MVWKFINQCREETFHCTELKQDNANWCAFYAVDLNTSMQYYMIKFATDLVQVSDVPQVLSYKRTQPYLPPPTICLALVSSQLSTQVVWGKSG